LTVDVKYKELKIKEERKLLVIQLKFLKDR